MHLIKILNVPPGEAPLWVRKEWVGILLPTDQNASVFLGRKGVVSGKYLGEGKDYPVKAGVAIELLRRSSPKAAEWWDRLGYDYRSWLLFPQEVCEDAVWPIDLSSLEQNIVSIMEAHFVEKLPLVTLMGMNHLLMAWLYHHKMMEIFNSLDDRQLLEPFWGLCSRYFIELSDEEKVRVMQDYLDD